MDTLRKNRVLALRVSLLLIAIAAGVAFCWSALMAQGIVLGGLSGVAGFWLLAARVEKLTQGEAEALNAFSFKWTVVRMGLYGAGLGGAWLLDRETYVALLGAVAALIVSRMLMIFVAFAGIRSKKDPSSPPKSP
ncbi:MAG: hypothetical protein HYV27_08270 [Candidatus Hydrogenedentes bacterium]|nr:hypothetical protein [Candidatus Hydrogenedentota bacterium]